MGIFTSSFTRVASQPKWRIHHEAVSKLFLALTFLDFSPFRFIKGHYSGNKREVCQSLGEISKHLPF